MRFKKNVRMMLLYLAFIVIGVAMVFPFIWMIATSFKTGTDIYSLSLLPKKFTLENYREVLSGSDFPRWFLNSFLVAGITTLSVLVFDPLLGYAFCKYRFRGKEAIFTMLLSTMMIPHGNDDYSLVYDGQSAGLEQYILVDALSRPELGFWHFPDAAVFYRRSQRAFGCGPD